MSKYGLEIMSENGELVMSPDVKTMVFLKKINLSVSTNKEYDFDLGIPFSVSIIAFKKNLNNAVPASFTASCAFFEKNGNAWVKILFNSLSQQTISYSFYFFFLDVGALETPKYGLELYDQNGNKTYSSAYKTLRAKQVVLSNNINSMYQTNQDSAVICAQLRLDMFQLNSSSYFIYSYVPCCSNGNIFIGRFLRGVGGLGQPILNPLKEFPLLYINSSDYD